MENKKCPAAKRESYRVRSLRVVQKLLKRDMSHQGLGLRGGARGGTISPGTLAFVLDADRVIKPDEQPKRGFRRGTLLQLREIPWISTRTTVVLDGLLARHAQSRLMIR